MYGVCHCGTVYVIPRKLNSLFTDLYVVFDLAFEHLQKKLVDHALHNMLYFFNRLPFSGFI